MKYKKLVPEARFERANETDAGYDLIVTSIEDENGVIVYGTGIAVEIPENYVGFLVPRSSVYKRKLIMANNIGVIDSGYRGEIKALFYCADDSEPYKLGERCAQLIVCKFKHGWEEGEISASERCGFGSTGN